MAAVPILIAVRLLATQTAFRTLTYSAPAWLGGPGLAAAVTRFERLVTDDMSDEEATAVASDGGVYPVYVTTFADPFVLRKLQVQFTHQDAIASTDDVRVCTFHLAKTSGSSVVDTWDAADFATVHGAFTTFWDSIKDWYSARVILDRYKFYRVGPGIPLSGPPVFDLEVNNPGTFSGNALPPQVAITVTEMAGSKPHWGRFYLPPPVTGGVNTYSRIDPTLQAEIADGADAMYTALAAANLPIVVYRPALPAREKKNGTELPARAASAWTVDSIQVDDIFDVIRSRRWKYPQLRLQRATP